MEKQKSLEKERRENNKTKQNTIRQEKKGMGIDKSRMYSWDFVGRMIVKKFMSKLHSPFILLSGSRVCVCSMSRIALYIKDKLFFTFIYIYFIYLLSYWLLHLKTKFWKFPEENIMTWFLKKIHLFLLYIKLI